MKLQSGPFDGEDKEIYDQTKKPTCIACHRPIDWDQIIRFLKGGGDSPRVIDYYHKLCWNKKDAASSSKK